MGWAPSKEFSEHSVLYSVNPILLDLTLLLLDILQNIHSNPNKPCITSNSICIAFEKWDTSVVQASPEFVLSVKKGVKEFAKTWIDFEENQIKKLPWWSGGKNLQNNVVVELFFVKPTERRSVIAKQLVAMFLQQIGWNLSYWRTVYCFSDQSNNKTKQLIRKILEMMWRSPLFLLLFLTTRSTKESTFDWFKSHSSLFW